MAQALCLSGRWLYPNGEMASGFVQIEESRIRQVGAGPAPCAVTHALPLDAVILPGFIDLQINGAFGVDLTANPGGIATLSAQLPAHGVTSFLPTIISSPVARYPDLLAACELSPAPGGARPLGLHLEGPFLQPERRGAHDPAALALPTPENLAGLLRPELVRLITLAPELPGGLEAMGHIRRHEIIAGIGHSNSGYDEARQSFEAGAAYAVHLFNAMPPLHHRRPGLVGALLQPDAPPVGLIADGIHVHPAMVRLAYTTLGVEGITLVSDAMAAAGLGPGHYSLGQQQVTVDTQGARLADGTLAGSAILLDGAVRNMVKFGICGLAEAAMMASLTPARVLGMDHHKGKILPGYDADLVVLDGNLDVYLTIIDGNVVYERKVHNDV
jgi:N-acetylglucosamine-6-phosphate deacetylase